MTASQLPGLVTVKLIGSIADGAEVQETLHCQTDDESPNTNAGMADLLDAINDAMGVGSPYLARKSVHYTLQRIQVEDLSPTALVTQSLNVSQPGGLSGDAAPSNVCLVVKTLTANSGRAYRGRVYFGGLAASDFGGGGLSWDGAAVTAYQAIGVDFIAAPQAAVTQPYLAVIWHRPPESKRPKTPLLADTVSPIITVEATATFRTQRRREYQVGI